MKPKISPAQEEKRRKRRIAAFGIVMILLMVLSPVAYYMTSDPTAGNQMTYGEYEFRLEDRPDGGSVLETEINGQPVEFQNLPVQVSYLSVDPAAITIMQGAQQVALVADPGLSIQEASLVDYARLQLGFALRKTVNGMTREDARYALPVLNCSYASPTTAVVIIDVTNETAQVTTDGYCITLQGSDRDLLRLKDRIIFEYYGILANGEVPAE